MKQTHSLDQDLIQRSALMHGLLDDCRDLIKNALMEPPNIHHKGKVDLVTSTDLAVEKCLIDGILASFPNDDILAEESGEREQASDFRWIIDPIDGTTNFSNRLPHFAISVGLQYRGECVLGYVDDVSKGMRFRAERGKGTTMNGQPIHVSQTKTLGNALLATGFSYDRQTRPDNNVAEFDHMLRRCRGMRRMGAAALDFAYVAAGWLDGYWEYRLHPWDVAAGVLLVEEAGGTVSRLDGTPYRVTDQHFCATNGHIHHALLSAVQNAPRRVTPVGDEK